MTSKPPSYLWTAFGLEPATEQRFHPARQWRFDYSFFCFPYWKKVAVEIEGGIWIKGKSGRGGAHSLPSNIIRDMEKHNAAVRLGWKVLRFTPQQLAKGEAQTFTKSVLEETS